MEHPGQTTRPPAYAELLIDSLDRYGPGYPTDDGQVTSSSSWQTNLQQYSLFGYFTRLAVTQIQFFWNLPTIIAGYNDQIEINVTAGAGAGQYLVTIPEGFYTPTTLAAAIETALQAAAPAATFTVTYLDQYGGFEIDAAGVGTQFYIEPDAGDAPSRLTRFYDTAGFLPGNAPADNVQGGAPTMLATRFIDLCSGTLTKFQRVKDSTTLIRPTITNVIARIYPTAPNTRVTVNDLVPVGSCPFTILIDYNTPKFIKWNPEEALANFDLQLRDQHGALLPFFIRPPPNNPPITSVFPWGCEYQITMLASES
jgi:hypothetical protein